MKLYTFNATGGSPYDGDIVIIAKTWNAARRKALQSIKEHNAKHSKWSKLSLTGWWSCKPFNPPCVVHFDSGER